MYSRIQTGSTTTQGDMKRDWRIWLPSIQRIREEQFDCVAHVKAVAAPIGIEVATHFERIELRVGQRDRTVVHAALYAFSMRPDPFGGGGTCFSRVHETCFSAKSVAPRLPLSAAVAGRMGH